MIPNLIELNTKNDSDDVIFSDAKSIIDHNECSVCNITPNESSQSDRARVKNSLDDLIIIIKTRNN